MSSQHKIPSTTQPADCLYKATQSLNLIMGAKLLRGLSFPSIFLVFLMGFSSIARSGSLSENTNEISLKSPYNICAVYPHLKDSYWLSVNYGMVEQAKKLGVNFKVYESGGYPNINKQRQQLEACVRWGADAIILGTVSPTLYNDDLTQYSAETPIFATVNHLVLNESNSAFLKGAVGVDWYWMGYLTGQYLVEEHPPETGPINVALLPGPASSGGTKPAIKGFYDAIKHSDIHIVETLWADNDKELQRNLVQALLMDHDVEYIVGSAVAIEAAITEVRNRQKGDQVKLVSMYLSHGVYRGIVRGRVKFSPTDQMVKQGQLSIQQAYDYLTGQPYKRIQAPKIQSITHSDARRTNIQHSLSPSGFRPTFSVDSVD